MGVLDVLHRELLSYAGTLVAEKLAPAAWRMGEWPSAAAWVGAVLGDFETVRMALFPRGPMRRRTVDWRTVRAPWIPATRPRYGDPVYSIWWTAAWRVGVLEAIMQTLELSGGLPVFDALYGARVTLDAHIPLVMYLTDAFGEPRTDVDLRMPANDVDASAPYAAAYPILGVVPCAHTLPDLGPVLYDSGWWNDSPCDAVDPFIHFATKLSWRACGIRELAGTAAEVSTELFPEISQRIREALPKSAPSREYRRRFIEAVAALEATADAPAPEGGALAGEAGEPGAALPDDASPARMARVRQVYTFIRAATVASTLGNFPYTTRAPAFATRLRVVSDMYRCGTAGLVAWLGTMTNADTTHVVVPGVAGGVVRGSPCRIFLQQAWLYEACQEAIVWALRAQPALMAAVGTMMDWGHVTTTLHNRCHAVRVRVASIDLEVDSATRWEVVAYSALRTARSAVYRQHVRHLQHPYTKQVATNVTKVVKHVTSTEGPIPLLPPAIERVLTTLTHARAMGAPFPAELLSAFGCSARDGRDVAAINRWFEAAHDGTGYELFESLSGRALRILETYTSAERSRVRIARIPLGTDVAAAQVGALRARFLPPGAPPDAPLPWYAGVTLLCLDCGDPKSTAAIAGVDAAGAALASAREAQVWAGPVSAGVAPRETDKDTEGLKLLRHVSRRTSVAFCGTVLAVCAECLGTLPLPGAAPCVTCGGHGFTDRCYNDPAEALSNPFRPLDHPSPHTLKHVNLVGFLLCTKGCVYTVCVYCGVFMRVTVDSWSNGRLGRAHPGPWCHTCHMGREAWLNATWARGPPLVPAEYAGMKELTVPEAPRASGSRRRRRRVEITWTCNTCGSTQGAIAAHAIALVRNARSDTIERVAICSYCAADVPRIDHVNARGALTRMVRGNPRTKGGRMRVAVGSARQLVDVSYAGTGRE